MFRKAIQLVCIGLFFYSCSSNQEVTPEETIIGTWFLIKENDKKSDQKEGILFSKTKHFFRVDSQGRTVPRFNDKVWSIQNDSLIVIDYNWEPDFIDKKGTFIYHVDSLTQKTLQLTLLNKKKQTTLLYHKK